MTTSNVKVFKNFEQNVKWLKEKLGVGKSFDIVCREISIAGKNGAIFFVDGFASLIRVARKAGRRLLLSSFFRTQQGKKSPARARGRT